MARFKKTTFSPNFLPVPHLDLIKFVRLGVIRLLFLASKRVDLILEGKTQQENSQISRESAKISLKKKEAIAMELNSHKEKFSTIHVKI